MRPEISRQRIEKYLEAHGIQLAEYEIMKLTRHLIDLTPEEAKKELKIIILRQKGFDELETSTEVHVEGLLHNPAEGNNEVKPKGNLVSSVRNSDDTVVTRFTKKKYVLDNIIGFVVFGFVVVLFLMFIEFVNL
jgi:hypothetical protein